MNGGSFLPTCSKYAQQSLKVVLPENAHLQWSAREMAITSEPHRRLVSKRFNGCRSRKRSTINVSASH